jgi:two-component system response regulator YesN
MDRRVRAVIAMMTNSLHRNVSLTEMAKTVRLSTSHLRRLFKSETGQSVLTYLNDLRLQRACALLETTFLSVKEIAARVGRSPNYLITNFKKAHGVTPAQFAARYRKAARRGNKRERNG